jgi:hypothetical protein
MIPLNRDLASDDISLISNATLSLVGSAFVSWRADDENELIVANCSFHKRGQLIAGCRVPLIEHNVNAVASQPSGELVNPRLVSVVVP